MRIFAIVFATLLLAALFVTSEAGHAKKKRLIKKLVKGALVAKVLKPKFLPLPLPIPIPIPIGIHKSIGFSHVLPEPLYLESYDNYHHAPSYGGGSYGGSFGASASFGGGAGYGAGAGGY